MEPWLLPKRTCAWDNRYFFPDKPFELHDEYDVFEPMEPKACKPEVDDFSTYFYDALITAELLLP